LWPVLGRNFHYHYLLFAGYLHLCSWNKPYPKGIQCCSYPIVTIHGAYNVISNIKCIILLRQYCPKYMRCSQYGYFFCSSLIMCFPGVWLRYVLICCYHHHLLYTGYLYLYSRDKLCP
jgi:hypothetical protein